MRISGGTARGIPLRAPPGDAVRPATDGMRQAVFSSLGARVAGSRVLDLFAGSGSYGLEALSRGASFCFFVEQNGKAAACIRQNLDAVSKSLGRRPADLAKVLVVDALSSAALAQPPPDLVFVDPPYELIEGLAPALFSLFDTLLAGDPDALVLFEMPGECTLNPAGWTCLKRLGKGVRQPSVAFFRRGG